MEENSPADAADETRIEPSAENRRRLIACGAIVALGLSVGTGWWLAGDGNGQTGVSSAASSGAGNPEASQEFGSHVTRSASPRLHVTSRVSLAPAISGLPSISLTPAPSILPSTAGGPSSSPIKERQFAGDPTVTGDNPQDWHNGVLLVITPPTGAGYKDTRIGYHDTDDPTIHWSQPITGTQLINPAFMRTGHDPYYVDVKNECEAESNACKAAPVVGFTLMTDTVALVTRKAFEPVIL